MRVHIDRRTGDYDTFRYWTVVEDDEFETPDYEIKESIAEQRDPPLITMRAEGAGETRITLTAPVLREAMHTHLLIMGEGKRDAFERARSLPPEQAPIRALLAEATVHWAA